MEAPTRSLSREDIQKAYIRWQQIKQQYGEQAIQIPEFIQLSKLLRAASQQQQALQQAQQRGQQGQIQKPQQTQPPQNLMNGVSNGQMQNMPSQIQQIQQRQASRQPIQQQQQQQQQPQPPQQPPQQQQALGQTQMPQQGNRPGIPDPFTPTQYSLLKAQFHAFRLLVRHEPIPIELINFLSNNQLAQPQIGSNLPPSQQSPPPQQVQQPAHIQVAPQQPSQLQGVAKGMMAPVGQPPLVKTPTSNSLKTTPKSRPKSRPSITAKTPNLTVLKPQPPQNLSTLSKEYPEIKNIVPIQKPDVQVDAFTLPEYNDDIPYASLNTPKLRSLVPGMFPKGINVEEAAMTRELLTMLDIDDEVQRLKSKTHLTDTEFLRLVSLELLPYQKALKGHLLNFVWFKDSLLTNTHPNFLAKMKKITLDDVLKTNHLFHQQQSQALEMKQNLQIAKINSLTDSSKKFLSKKNNKKDRLARLGKNIYSFHHLTEREEQKRIERNAKQRLLALKANDEEAYIKLLDQTKDTRITHLLKQTNQFLDSLAQAVRDQQKASHQNVMGSKPDGQDLEPPIDDEDVDEAREKIDYYEVAHKIKEEVTRQPSLLIGGTLKEYQLKGLQWMVSLFNNHLNGILADEMGLGKTIQTISLITYLVEVKKIQGPFLVIVPLSTLTNWNLEFEKWAPGIKKITYKGAPNQRKQLQYEIRTGNFQILLTTFEYIIKDRPLLSKIRWVHMIIDEGHRMKNANSKLSYTLTQYYHSDYRLILTGTPLQNNLPELWALLNFVLPKIFNSVKSFDEWFNTPFANTGSQDKMALSEEETLLVIRRLHKVLRPFLLRRLKKDVEKDLPNKIEKVVKCKMSALQAKLYQQMLKYHILFIGDSDKKPVGLKGLNNQIMQLRKICNHPFVFEEIETLVNPTHETNDNIWRVAGKFELLDKILPKFKATGHRVLIFFQMTQIMDIMEDFLRLRDMKYMRLDGTTKSDDRTGLLKAFNAPNSEYFAFLLSTRAGGLGLNLQTADTVIIFDTDWNPHQDLQAQDRAHRIGQKNEVRILRLITEDSVEEMILERAHQKLDIDGKVIQAGKFDNKSTSEEQEALLRALLEKEDDKKNKMDDDEMDDDELNEVLARNPNELILFRKFDEERIANTRRAPYPSRLYSEPELPEIYTQDPELIFAKPEEVYGRGTRERKATHYDDNLSEEQWLKAIDAQVGESSSDSDSTEAHSAPKRKRVRKKPMNIEDGLDSDDSSISLASRKRRQPMADFIDEDEDPGKRSKNSPAPGSRPSSARSKAKPSRVRSRASRAKKNSRQGTPLSRVAPAIDLLSEEERGILDENTSTIYDAIVEETDPEGRVMCGLFLVKPQKKVYPDYYVLIKNPIALDMIKKRIDTKVYTTITEFLEDIHLMFSNARIYNAENSDVYANSIHLEQLALQKYKDLYEDADDIDFKQFDETYNLKPLAIPGIKVVNDEDMNGNSALQTPLDNLNPEDEEDEEGEFDI